MEKTALIFSIISLIISFLAYTKNVKQEVIINKPIPKRGAVFFSAKKPEQIRIEKKLKQEKELNIEELC